MNERSIPYSLEDIPALAAQLKELMPQISVFTLTGPLGAGKTTLVSELLSQCGVTDPVTSPTFTYLNCYKNALGQRFYHFDLYRINSLDEFIAGGFQEFLYQPHSWAFIEWPEPIEHLLTDRVCRISLEYALDGGRIANITW